MANQRALLAVFAHPDDETFGSGGSLARYAREGVQVVLVCATRGEAGEIADNLATPETLPQVREGELRCAAEAMGISEVIFLGYHDSGMAGTPMNNAPGAFVNAPAEEVVARLVGIIRRVRPQVVLTFDPNGGYGHPDHITVHQRTVEAFHAAADPALYLEQGEPWRSARLFYSVIPRSFFRTIRDRLEELGMDVSEFARFEESDIGWPDEQIAAAIDISSTIDAKWTALRCHRTQFGTFHFLRRLPENTVKQMMSREHFALGWPTLAPGERLADLFAGL